MTLQRPVYIFAANVGRNQLGTPIHEAKHLIYFNNNKIAPKVAYFHVGLKYVFFFTFSTHKLCNGKIPSNTHIV